MTTPCKFFELHTANKSQLAEQALALIGQIYEAERQAQGVEADERLRIRQQQSRSAVDRLHLWLTEHRGKVPSGSATAKAMDYSLRRWPALTRFLCAELIAGEPQNLESGVLDFIIERL